MNKKILIAVCSAIVLFNSCNDDKEPEQFSIIGVWKPSRQIVVGSNGVTISNTDYSGCYKSSTFSFSTNNTMTSHIFDLNAVQDCENYGSETVPYSYDHNEKKLVIDGEDVEIVSRTYNELQFVSDYHDVDGDGVEEKIITVFVK